MRGKWLLAVLLASASPAAAHDWYPMECCHAMDCAPVIEMTPMPMPVGIQGLPPMMTRTKFGTTIVPPDAVRRESKDHRTHVCMNIFVGDPIKPFKCIFIPPST